MGIIHKLLFSIDSPVEREREYRPIQIEDLRHPPNCPIVQHLHHHPCASFSTFLNLLGCLEFLTSSSAKLSNLGNNLQIVRFFENSSHGLSVLEQNHRRSLCVTIPKLGKFRIILLFDTADSGSVLQQSFGTENIILDVSFRVGIVKIDQDRKLFRKQSQNLIHSVVLCTKLSSCRSCKCNRCRLLVTGNKSISGGCKSSDAKSNELHCSNIMWVRVN
mmetsp:Transcript_20804/g.28921  ORF Transcript_20804/g.28921 Transcript_20804/m.28921 type:complete len:218 (+) Transcript_20804:98-751(+)